MALGIRKNVDCAVLAPEADIEMVVGPKHPDLGASLRIFVLALPVVAESDRLGP
jgi:hypothetical protein